MSGGVILPAHLRSAAPSPERRPTRAYPVTGPAKAQVLVSAVNLGRQGWKHEVQVEWNTRDADGPVIKRDLLWLTSFEDTLRLAEAAHDHVSRHTPGPGWGLSGLARQHGITVK